MLGSLLALVLLPTPAAEQRCELRVQVVNASTGRALEDIAVNLRLSERTTVQLKSDASGMTCFTIPKLIEGSASIDAFSAHYLSVGSDPFVKQLPSDVTIRMRRLSWMESLKHVLTGE